MWMNCRPQRASSSQILRIGFLSLLVKRREQQDPAQAPTKRREGRKLKGFSKTPLTLTRASASPILAIRLIIQCKPNE